MGTNYYWHPLTFVCPTCDHTDEEKIHIGKSSAGWTFHFNGTDEIRSWKDWQAKFCENGKIIDEYGGTITAVELNKKVLAKMKAPSNALDDMKLYSLELWREMWKDDDGHIFSDCEFS